MLRWGLNRIEKIPEESGEKALWGIERHDEMEQWLRYGKTPTFKECVAAMRYSPAPKSCSVEVPVRFDLGRTSWVGYIDAAYDWRLDTGPLTPAETEDVKKMRSYGKPAGRPAPLGSTGVTVVHDHKFTSSWEYALDCESLYHDFAANAYAKEAFEGGATRVFCRWVYTLFEGQSPREIWAEMNYAHGEEILMDGELKAEFANHLRAEISAGRMRVDDLDKDTSHCFDFHKACPHKGNRCNPVKQTERFKPRSRDQMDSFESETAANFGNKPGASLPPLPGKALPPLPGKAVGEAVKSALPPLPGKALPPPPPKKAGADPKAVEAIETKFKGLFAPEAGFVNPVGGPTVAAGSPEEAIAAGNVAEAEDDIAVEADDLEGKSIGDLKAIAAAIGATHAPKAKTAGVTAAIRARRAELELAGELSTAEAESVLDAAVEAGDPAALAARRAELQLAGEMGQAEVELTSAIVAEEGGADGAREAREEAEAKLERLDALKASRAALDSYEKPAESLYEERSDVTTNTSLERLASRLHGICQLYNCEAALNVSLHDTESTPQITLRFFPSRR
jgi:hypothetical protein